MQLNILLIKGMKKKIRAINKSILFIVNFRMAIGLPDTKGTTIGDDHTSVVAAFSSRGPNFASPGILKLDIIGPGVNILAAWHISLENNTNTNSRFNMISGTSMSCPRLSGVAALLKSVHPDWSPAAIKSAIMTTANVLNLGSNLIEDETYLPANVFATGAGHVNPTQI
ncbi:hypothetical protein K7X08_013188 [Anisodus acutangulus]|uniref:Peptidase S8/S53 domain-containing protein n=1 Tax=Anisodus acutangulus TaxID=402998 RepID=A0A9Q1MAQ1_9SOLA|nr:hypothetical protein K7X08_013188 [Anisodus acutangulus]